METETQIMMKKAIIPFMALAAVSIAVPAVAQNYGQGPGHNRPGYQQSWNGGSIAARTGHLERNIAFAQRAGVMSAGKARDFHRDIARLIQIEHEYRSLGMSPGRYRDLERRYQNIDRAIQRYVDRARPSHRRR